MISMPVGRGKPMTQRKGDMQTAGGDARPTRLGCAVGPGEKALLLSRSSFWYQLQLGGLMTSLLLWGAPAALLTAWQPGGGIAFHPQSSRRDRAGVKRPLA